MQNRPAYKKPALSHGVAKHNLALCWVKLGLRMAQVARRPGRYSLEIIVKSDGRKELVLDGGKREKLGM